MRVGFLMESQFVYSQHCKVAARVGLDRAKIDAISHWGVATHWSPIERAVLAYTDEFVLERGRVQDGVFNALHTEMSDEDIMELTYHIGGYMLHAGFCRALRLEWDDVRERIVEVPLPEGATFGGFTGEKTSRAECRIASQSFHRRAPSRKKRRVANAPAK